MSVMMRFAFYLIFFCFTLSAQAQDTDSLFRSLISKLQLNDTTGHSDLFLHFDKNVYSANENAWFAAYLMHTADLKAHHTLYVTLLNEMDHSVAASYSFALEGGLASGNIPLPDSLETGKYYFAAYTNKSIAEWAPHIFRQPVDVLGRKRPVAMQRTGTYRGDSASLRRPLAENIQRFPDSKPTGWRMQPRTTIVNDTLRLAVSSPDPAGNCVLLIHNSRSVLYSAYLRLRNPTLSLKIPVADWGTGIAHVCLFTPDGILQEKRLVLVKQQKGISASLKADSAVYKPLSKVAIKLKLTDAKGGPLKGLFSFSCALEPAITAKRKSIEIYDAFERFLPDRVVLPPWEVLQNDQNVRSLLLKQENLMADTSLISVPLPKPGQYDGYVLHNSKKPKKPVSMMLAGTQPAVFETDNEGRFTMPYQPLRADASKTFLLTVLAKNQLNYRIEMVSPMARINASLANQNLLHTYLFADELSAEQRLLLESSKAIRLDEVVIASKKEDPENFYGKSNERGVCDDTVCMWEFINCTHHPPVKKAVEGERYNLETSTGTSRKKVTYHCPYNPVPPYMRSIPPTVTYTPFSPFNPSEQNLPENMDNTTLHWQAFIETDEKGEATISFHNNARSGRFKAEVQGLIDNGAFTSQVSFEVKQ